MAGSINSQFDSTEVTWLLRINFREGQANLPSSKHQREPYSAWVFQVEVVLREVVLTPEHPYPQD